MCTKIQKLCVLRVFYSSQNFIFLPMLEDLLYAHCIHVCGSVLGALRFQKYLTGCCLHGLNLSFSICSN